MKIEFLDEVGSTNDYIKRYLNGGENVIVCAKRQTGGRGTKGRSFLSEAGGVYLSALTFYENLLASDAFWIMTHAAVSVCKTAKQFGAVPQIKWPNDILLNGKKLCGILTENCLRGRFVRASIVGIGLNVCNDLSPLNGIAASLSEVAPAITVEEARDALIENYQRKSTFEEYLSFVRFLGKEVRVIDSVEYVAVARRILSDGRLEVEASGAMRTLSAAEISIKPQD